MKIHDLMTPHVETAHPDTPLSEAAQRMKDREIGFLPILNPATGKIDGVLTDRDICMAALERNAPLSALHVREAMNHQVRSCREDTDVTKAHALMRTHHVRRLPVTNTSGSLVGVPLLSLGSITTTLSMIAGVFLAVAAGRMLNVRRNRLVVES